MITKLRKLLDDAKKDRPSSNPSKLYLRIRKIADILMYIPYSVTFFIHEYAHYVMYLISRLFLVPVMLAKVRLLRFDDFEAGDLEASIHFSFSFDDYIPLKDRFFIALIAIAPIFLIPPFFYLLVYGDYGFFSNVYFVFAILGMLPSEADRFVFQLAVFGSTEDWKKLVE